MHLWRWLGIARLNKFVGLCFRLAQTFGYYDFSTIVGYIGTCVRCL